MIIIDILYFMLTTFIVAEFIGYWLHVLLHSGTVRWLSKNHMIHHITIYGPGQNQRPKDDYIHSVINRFGIFDLGIEWLVPITILIPITAMFEHYVLRFGWIEIVCSIIFILAYSWVMFSWLHGQHHCLSTSKIIRKSPRLIKRQFIRARKFHDIHHHYVNNKGLMNRNYGIGFCMFDKLFGSHMPTLKGGINKESIKRVKERYRL